MPETKRVRVLLCGGHLDGHWVDVPEGVSAYRAMKPQALTLAPEPEVTVPFPEVAEYRLEPMPIRIRHAGGTLWVGTLGYGPGCDEAIVRALFQRDVTQELLGGRRANP
ncbi:hypothetical protein [Streptomyces sp. Amel2xC10]|uniref:hypothetical protein n=1 Tax=Streptomyces sp. Amel2xC10 TaxID=1305826 RepID=UPI000A08BBF1|nr:hypothetical protein [Streptomyces sp. Amel2xC10]SMF86680.1 hypothetical protein SAMN02745830_07200 [Streptomyces sp. Amel2xC10]